MALGVRSRLKSWSFNIWRILINISQAYSIYISYFCFISAQPRQGQAVHVPVNGSAAGAAEDRREAVPRGGPEGAAEKNRAGGHEEVSFHLKVVHCAAVFRKKEEERWKVFAAVVYHVYQERRVDVALVDQLSVSVFPQNYQL